MTLSVSAFTSAHHDSGTTLSVTWTPPANSLLVAFVTGTQSSSTVMSTSGLTWTRQIRSVDSFHNFTEVWTAPQASSASRVFLDTIGSSDHQSIHTCAFTDSSGALPVVGNVSGSGSASPRSASVTSAQVGAWAFAVSMSDGPPDFSAVTGQTLQDDIASADGYYGGDVIVGVYSLDAKATFAGQSMSLTVPSTIPPTATDAIAAIAIEPPVVPFVSFAGLTGHQALHPKVEVAFGFSINSDPATWVFTDITRYVQGPVTLTAGAQSTASSVDPSTISLELANTDGRFTARSPLLRNGQPNPYWPNVVRNVPMRVSISWDGASGAYELLTAFVNGWPLQPNAGVINVTVPILATGRLRRMQRSNKQNLSAMTRTIGVSDPDAWWPLEDSTGTQLAGSGIPGRPPMNVINATGVMFAGTDGAPGTGPLVSITGNGSLSAKLPNTAAVQYRIEIAAKLSAITVGDFHNIIEWTTVGGIATWDLNVTDVADGGLYVTWVDATGANTATYVSNIGIDDDQWHHIRVGIFSVSGHVTVTVTLDGVQVINQATGRVTGVATGVTINSTGTTADGQFMSVGQLAYWAPWGNGPQDTYYAFTGYAGEMAAERARRLADESNVPIVVRTSSSVNSQTMGAQGVDILVNLLGDCVTVDNGSLHDAGAQGALVFTSGTARYNAPIGMTLNYQQRQIGDGLAATYDDQNLVTEVVVSRQGGSSIRYIDPDAEDDYVQSVTVNAYSDKQLPDLATWLAHMGTYDAYRIASVSIDIRNRSPELAQAATSLEIPFRISPTNLPPPYPPLSFDQFAEGFTTVIDSVTWQTQYNCSPYGPWQVGVWNVSRYDSTSSTLTSPITATATSLSVTTANTGDLWTTASGQRPFQIMVGGEVMTVTNLTSSSSPQTFTVTRGVNGVALTHAAGEEVHIYPQAVYALGASAVA